MILQAGLPAPEAEHLAQVVEDKGVEGIITSNAYYEAPWARGDIRIYSRNMQNQLERGKEDLSLGYSCRYTEQPGIWNGTPYEVVQDKMRGPLTAVGGFFRMCVLTAKATTLSPAAGAVVALGSVALGASDLLHTSRLDIE